MKCMMECGESQRKQMHISTSNQDPNHIIKVFAMGEISLPPDICRLLITLSNSKPKAEDAKNSVNRRLDYILQTLRRYSVMEKDIKITKSLHREKMYTMEINIIVSFVDYSKCQSLRNHLVEKLGDSVTISKTEFDHSPHILHIMRNKATLMAVRNAKQKAADIAQFLHAQVGSTLAIKEDHWDESRPSLSSTSTIEHHDIPPTMHVFTKVMAEFELRKMHTGMK